MGPKRTRFPSDRLRALRQYSAFHSAIHLQSTSVCEGKIISMQNITGNMPRVEGVGTALPSNYVSQESLFTALRDYWAERGARLDGFDRLHKATKVSGRYLALPMIEYRALDSFERSNNVWIRVASEIGSEAARNALSLAGVAAEEVDHLFLVTGTGIATPSIDSRIIATLGLRTDVKRTPIFGLGCAGGAAGIARAADYLRAFSNENALLIAVELCSLTLQHGDISVANMIASGLFGDGAAAGVISGGASGDRVGPQVVASRSILYPNTETLMAGR